MAGSSSALFSDSMVEFLSESDESCEVDALFEKLPLDVEATPTTPAPPTCTSSEPHPSLPRVTAQDLECLKAKNHNKNTVRSTETRVKVFERWRISRQIGQKLEEVPNERLDGILQIFFAEVRKIDGNDYEPDSLRTMQAALDRHLREKGCTFSIMRDRQFDASRKVLNGRVIESQERVLGKRKRRADSVTEEEEELLWSRGCLGGDNPTSLNLTVFYTISQHFGTCGCQ